MPAMSMITTPPYKWTPLTDEILHSVYASDQDMYPAPLPFARLRSWVDASPEFSMRLTCDRPNGSIINSTSKGVMELGVIITLPLLRPHWDALLCGKVKETDIDPAVAFADNSELGFVEDEKEKEEEEEEEDEVQEIGLHVFHVERYGGWGSEEVASLESGKREDMNENESTPLSESGSSKQRGGFCQMALEEVMRRAALRRRWKVVGFSALTATPAGNKTFRRLGFAPTGYAEEFVLRDAVGGVGVKGPVEMVCRYYPGEELPSSLVTTETTETCRVVARSEMMVKYAVP